MSTPQGERRPWIEPRAGPQTRGRARGARGRGCVRTADLRPHPHKARRLTKTRWSPPGPREDPEPGGGPRTCATLTWWRMEPGEDTNPAERCPAGPVSSCRMRAESAGAGEEVIRSRRERWSTTHRNSLPPCGRRKKPQGTPQGEGGRGTIPRQWPAAPGRLGERGAGDRSRTGGPQTPRTGKGTPH